jgi:hypothetical protein
MDDTDWMGGQMSDTITINGMKFTATPPSVPGAYWMAHTPIESPSLVEVRITRGTLWIYAQGGIGKNVDAFKRAVWCGPLQPPAAVEAAFREGCEMQYQDLIPDGCGPSTENVDDLWSDSNAKAALEGRK